MKRAVSKEDKLTDVELAKVKEIENGAIKSKRKYPGFRKNMLDYIQQYTDYTGIHGFKYMGEQDRSIFEKLWWLILFCISLYICIDLIIKTWEKWDTSPVLVSFARSPTPVWQIPFPAVTICSETKTKQTVYNFTDTFDKYRMQHNLTDLELKHLSDSALICDNHLYNAGNLTTGLDTIDYLMSVAPQFDDVFHSCRWTLQNKSCSSLFYPILTEEGLCFTFNMLDRSQLLRNKVYLEHKYMGHGKDTEDWTLEDGYKRGAKKDTFPRRAMSAGSSAGLFLELKAYGPDLDYICRGPVQGFKILLHHPAEVPRVSRQYFRAPLNQEVVVSIKPDMMTTSAGLKDYNPHRRQCFFPNERYLSFFQSYTQQNCQVECLTNFTLKMCNCVAYHMPHEESTPICGSGSIKCMFEAQTKLLEKEVESGLSSSTFDVSGDAGCDCLPACTSLTYNAESTQAEYNWKKMFEATRKNVSEFPGMHFTRLNLFFKQQQFINSERNELFGQTDFLANCGGILGLFTGFSFLSIVEIVHFLSSRLMCNVKMYGRHYWSGSAKLLNNDAYVHD
ncbi:pickpocket protein 28-like [Anoplophora glabripennis]|uniref:pickpocket protein 28-like n=1 Tax=Anoplophora glabripennis TaxID=217634 RepID=UPI000873BBA8|nr:pickpocket protein 28-like [Anoplophora glabripennis]